MKKTFITLLLIAFAWTTLLSVPAAFAEPDGTVVFSDDFSGGAADLSQNWTLSQTWDANGGTLNATTSSTSTGNGTAKTKTDMPQNTWIYFTMVSKDDSNAYARVYFRYATSSDNVAVQITPAGIKAGYGTPSATVCSNTNSACQFTTNQAYDFKIGVFDKQVDVYVKNQSDGSYVSLGSVDISSGYTGDLKVGKIQFTANKVYSFDNVVVTNRDSLDSHFGATAVAGDASVALTWDAVDGATGYKIERSSDGSSYTEIANNVTDTSYTDDDNLTNGTSYSYEVTAFNTAGDIATTSPVSATPHFPGTLLSAPEQLTANAGDAKVDLAWGTVADATGYNIKRGTVSGGPYTEIAHSVTQAVYSDSSVANGTTYYYIVTATNTTLESGPSNEVNATPIADAVLPSAPSDLTATTGNAKVDLAWSPVEGATGYNVKRSTANGGPYTEIAHNVNGTTYSDTGASSDVIYYYIVTALNAAGESANSNEAHSGIAAGAVSGLTLTAGDSQIDLLWNAVEGAASYNVKRREGDEAFAIIASNISSVSYTDDSVTNGHTYEYTVTAVSDSGTEGDPAPTVSGTPNLALTVPTTPTNLSATAGELSVQLSWSNCACSSGGYNVRRSTTSGEDYTLIALNQSSNSYTDTNVTAGTYYYVITAVNSVGESAFSNEARVVVQEHAGSPLAAPLGLTATTVDGDVMLTWGSVEGASGYNVKRSAGDNAHYEVVASNLTSPAYNDEGLIAGTTYYYTVTAVNGSQESVDSNEVSVTPTAPEAPVELNAPTGLTAKPGNGEVRLQWDAVSGATAYSVKRSRTSGGEYAVIAPNVTGTSYTDTAVSGNLTYYYVVTAVNASGESEPSNEAKAAPSGPANPSGPITGSVGGTLSNSGDVNVQFGHISAQTTSEELDGKTVGVTKVDAEDLKSAFDQINTNPADDQKVVIDLNSSDESTIVTLPGKVLADEAAANPHAALIVAGKFGKEEIPLSTIDWNDLTGRFGDQAADMELSIASDPVDGEVSNKIKAEANKSGATVIGLAANAQVTAKAGDQSIPLDVHGIRTVVLPLNVNPAKSTAVTYNSVTGELSFVPATFQISGDTATVTVHGSLNQVVAIIQSDITFEDMTDHWAKDETELLASKLIVKGESATEFGPNQSVTRAEFAALLVRSLGLTEDSGAATFSDVNNEAWYAGAVGAAMKANLIGGYTNNTFLPNHSITREEMAVMISRALAIADKQPQADASSLSKFKDGGLISDWAKEAIEQSMAAGIISGQSATSLAPKQDATRAEAAVMLAKLLQYIKYI